ncbi:SepM family pheromone-processing serine protease [Gracilibacillus alcaliphilus]|uniref:SepM family pheromone-processing serine protease n=1 Tax=Gracilibacillus alcaliphilus TaxID=1401441 RepID=UPI00195B5745|nr:SepM family pheromone-processing serine protease [Gracilibacillus alcaliphilus]MBM7678637.1 PDZ domain-containing protein [Gracilibacillus alcaliphilus]
MFRLKGNVRILIFFVALIAVFFLFSYRLPFYIHQPGHADPLNPIVEVDGGHESEGEMYLVTIQGGRATPFTYLTAQFRKYFDVLPINEVVPEDMTDAEYHELQLMMMESSQEASMVVAYEAAGETIDIEYKGVYVVSVVEGMPADGILQSGDEIIEIDGKEINESEDLIDYVTSKTAGDAVRLTIERDEQTMEEEIALAELEDLDGQPGIGIQLVTNRQVTVSPDLTFSSGSIGGPSAGLMFSLEIYDQLTTEDITKGYQIAGTGEVDYQGNVGRIGGVDKKVIAADRTGCDIFFAPNEGGREGSNYQVAKETAEDIGTDMEIVPVDTFEEALEYLAGL